MTFLCDTNVISELARSQPNPGVWTWIATVSSIALSVISLEEILYGLTSKPNAKEAFCKPSLRSLCSTGRKRK
jgi:predicted nucleic acid-binding protein